MGLLSSRRSAKTKRRLVALAVGLGLFGYYAMLNGGGRPLAEASPENDILGVGESPASKAPIKESVRTPQPPERSGVDQMDAPPNAALSPGPETAKGPDRTAPSLNAQPQASPQPSPAAPQAPAAPLPTPAPSSPAAPAAPLPTTAPSSPAAPLRATPAASTWQPLSATNAAIPPLSPTLAPDRAGAELAWTHAAALLAIGPRPGHSDAAQAASYYIEQQLRALSGPTGDQIPPGSPGTAPTASTPASPAPPRASPAPQVGSAQAKFVVERWPVGTVTVPPLYFAGQPLRAQTSVTTTDHNLIARFGPPATIANQALLLIAHYDSVAESPGAADNAIAVGVLLALARQLALTPPSFPVWLAFTAREEEGLLGAYALAANVCGEDAQVLPVWQSAQLAAQHHAPCAVGFAVALDLLGSYGELTINGASRLIGLSEIEYLAQSAAAARVPVALPFGHRVISQLWPQGERSDHGPFTQRGIRALHLYHRGTATEWIDIVYHSPADTLSRASFTQILQLLRWLRVWLQHPPPGVGRYSQPMRAGASPPSDAGMWLAWGSARWVGSTRHFPLVTLGLMLLAGLFIACWPRPRVRQSATQPGAGLLALLAIGGVAVVAAIAVERLLTPYPGAWVHRPVFGLIANASIILAVALAGVTVVGRWRGWHGYRRYTGAGCFWVAVQVVGFAWINTYEVAVPLAALLCVMAAGPLLQAAATAVLQRAAHPHRHWPDWLGAMFGLVACAAAAMPAVLILHPARLRELAFHGLMPQGLPLALVQAAALAPVFLCAAGIWRMARAWRHQPVRALPGVGLRRVALASALLALGITLYRTSPLTCDARTFAAHSLRCTVEE